MDDFRQYADMKRVLDEEDPNGSRRSCVSVGDTDGVLLIAAAASRFDRVADISKVDIREVDQESIWRDAAALARVLPPGTTVMSHLGNVFDQRAMEAVGVADERYDFCYLHKTLHHLRQINCKFRQAADEDEPNCHSEEHTCVGVFDPSAVLNRLLEFANTIIISEFCYVGKDDDQDDSQGGMLDLAEMNSLLALSSKYSMSLYEPQRVGVLRPSRRFPSLRYSGRLMLTVSHKAARQKASRTR